MLLDVGELLVELGPHCDLCRLAFAFQFGELVCDRRGCRHWAGAILCRDPDCELVAVVLLGGLVLLAQLGDRLAGARLALLELPDTVVERTDVGPAAPARRPSLLDVRAGCRIDGEPVRAWREVEGDGAIGKARRLGDLELGAVRYREGADDALTGPDDQAPAASSHGTLASLAAPGTRPAHAGSRRTRCGHAPWQCGRAGRACRTAGEPTPKPRWCVASSWFPSPRLSAAGWAERSKATRARARTPPREIRGSAGEAAREPCRQFEASLCG